MLIQLDMSVRMLSLGVNKIYILTYNVICAICSDVYVWLLWGKVGLDKNTEWVDYEDFDENTGDHILEILNFLVSMAIIIKFKYWPFVISVMYIVYM